MARPVPPGVTPRRRLSSDTRRHTNMKVALVVFAAVVAAAVAEAPQAPYPPSGWRPAKAFLLPLQFRQRYEQYGPPTPAPSYGPPPTPAASYGPPPATEAPTEAPEETTTEEATEEPTEAATEATTEEPEEETSTEAASEARANEVANNEVPQPSGLYYVLLPDGRLQRVLYSAGAPELGFNAQLRISDVEPVPPAPVYAYAGPLTRILRRAD